MSALGPMALNIFLPSMPGLARELGVDNAQVQLTLTLFLVTLGVAQLTYGPLSDRYGRRPMLLVGLWLYLAGSLVCTFAPGLDLLLVGRVLQAAGGCAGLVLGRAIIRDLYDRDRSAAMIGYVTMAMTLAPMFSPALGGYLDAISGWRTSFAFCSAAGLALLIWVTLTLPETLVRSAAGDPAAAGIRSLLGSYWMLLRSPAFCGYAFQTAFTSAVFFAFVSGAPFIVVTLLGQPPSTYGLWFIIVSVGYFTGNFLTGRFSVRFGVDRMIAAGATIGLCGIAALAVTGWLGFLTLPAIFLPMVVVAVANGLTLPSGIAGAISVEPRAAGAAAGLAGSLQMLVSAGASLLVGWGQDHDASQYPMIWTMLACGLLSVASFVIGARLRARRG